MHRRAVTAAICYGMCRRSDTSTNRSSFGSTVNLAADMDEAAGAVSDIVATAATAKTIVESLNGTVSAVHTALSGILTMLQSSQLATEQRNCLRDTFKCCICRGDVNFLQEFIS